MFAAAHTLRAYIVVLPPVVPPPGHVFVKTHAGKYLAVNYDLAIQIYTRSLARDPYDFDTYIRRAIAEGLKHEYLVAIADYSTALSLSPAFYTTQYLRRDGTTPDFPGALADCNATLVQDPKNVPALLNLALINCLLRNDPVCVIFCNLAIAADPRCAYAYYLRGVTERYDKEKALADFTQSLALEPRFADALLARAALWSDQGGPGPAQHAIDDLTAFIAINPSVPDAFRQRGDARFRQRDFKGALTDYAVALGLLGPDDKAAQSDLSDDGRNHRADLTLADNAKLTTLYNEIARVYISSAQTKRFQNDFAGALADCNQAITFDPDNLTAYRFRGEAETYTTPPDYDAAIADFNVLIDRNPRDANAIQQRGTAEKKKMDYPAALADYRASGDPVSSATIEMQMKDYGDAIADYTKVINRTTRAINLSLLLELRARAELADGDKDAATADLDKARALNPTLGQ
jgi:tetratricopeptide (TPR) repeat protein